MIDATHLIDTQGSLSGGCTQARPAAAKEVAAK